MGLFDSARSLISTIGYNLGAPQIGIGQNTSFGTQYDPYLNPQTVSSGNVQALGWTPQPQTTTTPQGTVPSPGLDTYSAPTTSGTPLGATPGQVPVNTQTGGTYPDQTSQIAGAWDSYINQLDSMLNSDLPGQQTALQGQAQGVATDATTQADINKTSNTRQVNESQATSLKDLGENVKNLFQAGNTYLGARGAGDSSAANMYSYAISKMGSKGRADIMSQANQRVQQIGDIYNTEKARITSELTSTLGQIAQWFYQSQQALRDKIGQAGLGKQQNIAQESQTIYNYALQAKQQVEAQLTNQQSMLTQWALNNSKTAQEVISKMQSIYSNPLATNALFGALPGGVGQTTAARPVGQATGKTWDPIKQQWV
jgi:hypothetical protein